MGLSPCYDLLEIHRGTKEIKPVIMQSSLKILVILILFTQANAWPSLLHLHTRQSICETFQLGENGQQWLYPFPTSSGPKPGARLRQPLRPDPNVDQVDLVAASHDTLGSNGRWNTPEIGGSVWKVGHYSLIQGLH